MVPKVVDSGSILWLICPIVPLRSSERICATVVLILGLTRSVHCHHSEADQLERVHRTNALITEAQVHYSGLILWLIQSVQCPTQSQISWIVRTDLDYQS